MVEEVPIYPETKCFGCGVLLDPNQPHWWLSCGWGMNPTAPDNAELRYVFCGKSCLARHVLDELISDRRRYRTEAWELRLATNSRKADEPPTDQSSVR